LACGHRRRPNVRPLRVSVLREQEDLGRLRLRIDGKARDGFEQSHDAGQALGRDERLDRRAVPTRHPLQLVATQKLTDQQSELVRSDLSSEFLELVVAEKTHVRERWP